MTAEKRTFQAEVSKLLKIVANSLYSEREVFLRELISNASDACDKLRYLALTQPDLTTGDGEYKIKIAADKDANTLTLSDNGIGMTADELNDNLGTIARSGTEAFVSNLSGDEKKDSGLIGQFGVGFYSAFMIADKVEVLTRRAGEDKAHLWSSDGLGEYTIADAEKANRGTIITMYLKEDALEFLEEQRLQHIVKRYSDHIPVPILFVEAKGEETKDGETEERPLNEASALWTRSKSDITTEQYGEFYKHVAHAFDEPWLTMHWKAEGVIEYSSLLYVPTQRPFDLFHPERKSRVKLYVKRVFITDDCDGLVPDYLRFMRGVIDCEDLPLNVSRELLQRNPVLQKISSAVTKRVLTELSKKAEKDPEAYAVFWDAYGPVMKEGIYSENGEHKDTLISLARFDTTESDTLVSLADYKKRMKEGQEAIYYIIGESKEALLNSPHIEGFKAKGVEVLLLSDPIDDFWIQAMFEGFEGSPLKSITRGSADLDAVKDDDDKTDEDKAADKKDEEKASADIAPLLASIKLALGEEVKDVRESNRLTDSPVCLIADDGDMDINLERLLRQHKQIDKSNPRILEVNTKHAVIKALAKRVKDGKTGQELDDAAHLLLDQARIMEGEAIPDPKAFARRMAMAMERGLAL